MQLPGCTHFWRPYPHQRTRRSHLLSDIPSRCKKPQNSTTYYNFLLFTLQLTVQQIWPHNVRSSITLEAWSESWRRCYQPTEAPPPAQQSAHRKRIPPGTGCCNRHFHSTPSRIGSGSESWIGPRTLLRHCQRCRRKSLRRSRNGASGAGWRRRRWRKWMSKDWGTCGRRTGSCSAPGKTMPLNSN